MVELPVECRPSIHQDEAGKSIVRMCSERKSFFLSPITIEPIVGVSTIRADFTIRRPDFCKFGKIMLIMSWTPKMRQVAKVEPCP